MSDNEDWRRRKAEELGLVATAPRLPRLPVQPTSPDIGRAAERTDGPPPAAGLAPEDPRSSAQAARTLILLVGLALAMLLGWWLRGTAAPDDAAQTVTRPAALPAMPAASASPLEQAMPDMPDMIEPQRAALPDAVQVPPPSRILPTAKRPIAGPAEPAPVAVSRAQPGRHTARRAVAAPGRNFSPSFNCSRASSSANRMICNDRALAALDVKMSNAYGRAIARVDVATERRIDAAQVRFLNKRSRCATAACIDRVYRNRIRELVRRQ